MVTTNEAIARITRGFIKEDLEEEINSIDIRLTALEGYTDEVESKITEAELALYSRKYEKVLYVGQNGDDSDGLSWKTAFRSFNAAHAAALSTGVTMINVGEGLWDVATAGRFLITKSIHIKGTGILTTTFINTLGNGGGHFVLYTSFNNDHSFSIEDCGFTTLVNARCNGLGINNADGVYINNILFRWMGSPPAPVYGINIYNGHGHVIKNIKGYGANNTDILYVAGAVNSKFENICAIGGNNAIRIAATACLQNEFRDIRAFNTNIGIWQCHGSNNVFTDLDMVNCGVGVRIESTSIKISITNARFTHCTDNIIDETNDAELAGIISTIKNRIYPDNLVGITLPNGGTPEVYGPNTSIIPAGTLSKPFKILAYTAAPSDDKKFIVRLSADSGVTHFIHMIDRRDGLNGELARILVLNDTIFSKNAEISGSMKCEVGDEDIDVWLYYQEI